MKTILVEDWVHIPAGGMHWQFSSPFHFIINVKSNLFYSYSYNKGEESYSYRPKRLNHKELQTHARGVASQKIAN